MTEMENYNHYDCKHFRTYDDGMSCDCYCEHKKEWFWIVEETPTCEAFEEDIE